MSAFPEQANKLKKILNLDRTPVGVKFLKNEQSLKNNNYDRKTKSRYCQALMRAGNGEKVVLDSSNIACAAAGAAFGLRPLHPKLASGEAYFKVGQVASPEVGKNIMEGMTRLQAEEYQYVMLSPLETIEYEPDIVVLVASMENIMWLAFASIYETGERLQFNSALIEATCVDSTIIPFVTKKINFSPGCLGCREATDIKSSEGIIGIPYEKINSLVKNLEKLNEKAIPQMQSKTAFNRFTQK